ncbi:hypothetical protein AVEN_197162-1 [Araneus ventricosus]|uniref:Tc1-like transposase DDE domain-containing protein n=1 Tax=Araneus ventricosus TaxID=182803 RepID=A0A4Y2SQ00_ARAVE|nr:hypothetical protein AVEN_197162-1 [Araneus ventricosus]
MRSSMWFQHDGAPAHYSIDVRLHLNATYGQQWIRRGGPVLWPARSPDLNCLDYFLWEYVKSLVYETLVNSALLQLLGKSGTRPVFSLTFDLQCAGCVSLHHGPGT